MWLAYHTDKARHLRTGKGKAEQKENCHWEEKESTENTKKANICLSSKRSKRHCINKTLRHCFKEQRIKS